MAAMGFFFGFLLALKKAKRDKLDEDSMYSLIIIIVIMALVGGRVFYIILNWKDFLQNTSAYILSREGFVFLGGFTFAAISALSYTALKKLPVWRYADVFAPSIAFGHALGRLGCFLNGCCYGKVGHGFLAMVFPYDSVAGYYHPYEPVIATQLISSLANFSIFVFLSLVYRNKKFDGQIFFLYFITYSIFRFIIEFIRGDYLQNQYYMFNLTISQLTGIFLFFSGLIMYFYLKNKKQNENISQMPA